MKSFQQFLIEAGPPPTGGMGGGLSTPGSLPGSPSGGLGPPPPGGMGGLGGLGPPPPGGMGGGLGGLGPPPPGGMGGPTQSQAPNKLKAYNIWDVLERVLQNGK